MMDNERDFFTDRPTEDELHFAALTLGGLALLVPQNEVHTLETVQDVELTDGDPGQYGLEVPWLPVYCLSVRLEALRAIPTENRICGGS